MEPRWYHQNGITHEVYKGDRHPSDGYPPDYYEPEERACRNCGEVGKMFKKKYLDFKAFDYPYTDDL